MLTLTSEYSLKAMVFLAAREPGQYTLAREVAQQLGIPRLYLSKILQILTRRGLLRSQRGRNGGFALAKPAPKISVLEILDAVGQAERFQRCLLGFEGCGEGNPCPIHDAWAEVRARMLELFNNTTIADLVHELKAPAKPSAAKDPSRRAASPRRRLLPRN
jgi:Rrf2 family protein